MKSDKLYRFRSSSQHMLVVSVLGRKMKVKFSTPYQGVARYSTSNEIIARQISNSRAFTNRLIVEDEAAEIRINGGVENRAEEARETAKTPEWMKRSLKTTNKPSGNFVQVMRGAGGKPAANKSTAVESKVTTEANRQENKDAVTEDMVSDKTTTGSSADSGQTNLFQLTREDVDSYMAAKEYVKEVLRADVNKKEEVKAYCLEHNIVFPNFSFD